ncbi:VWA domain-containing protein [Arthrobacter sp. SO5]|uniref:VWA domain-containing protein n=1 Tax=Arthrobacter sp. SO5 TaxID=1897055 RepID=UPI001E5D9309|nr:VWA domain-containing protein [Arthrobacter sp. SO5]
MSAIADDTVGGFAAFIRDQQAVAGRCRLSLAQFDDSYELVYAAVDIADVPPLDLQPRGSTALHDAMVRLIGEAGAELAALPEDERPGTVLVAVFTDGHENSSVEANGAMVKALVERQQGKWGWQFTYLGANQDAVLTAGGLGIKAEDALTYAAGNVDAAFSVQSAKMRRLREARLGGASMAEASAAAAYTAEERAAAGGGQPGN